MEQANHISPEIQNLKFTNFIKSFLLYLTKNLINVLLMIYYIQEDDIYINCSEIQPLSMWLNRHTQNAKSMLKKKNI